MATTSAGRIYADLGVRPVVNAAGNATILGGSILSPSVRQAMEQANEVYANMDELIRATGEAIAGLLETEAAFVTSGCGAAMALGTAACMTGDDTARMERIPDTTGMRNQVVIPRNMRYKYDRCPTIVGATLVEAGDEQATTAAQLAAAIGPATAGVLYYAMYARADYLRQGGRVKALPLAEVLEVAHGKGVPVLVDAAGEVYPLDYCRSFQRQGADLVCYGVKYFGGPNSTGVLAGRKDLVAAAYLNSFMGFEAWPHRAYGRPFKVDRQEVVGALAAIREWFALDHAARLRVENERAQRIVAALKDLSHLSFSQGSDDVNPSRLAISWDTAALAKTPPQVQAALREGNPSVWLYVRGGALMVATHCLRPGEEEIVARRLREELSR